MTDEFLPVPEKLLGEVVSTQEAIDWLAFGPPTLNRRGELSVDEQLASTHSAAGLLLLALWDDGLQAHVQSPASGTWYRIPHRYWTQPPSAMMAEVVHQAHVPHYLPSERKYLPERYASQQKVYAGSLPAGDIVGQLLAFSRAAIERYCAIAGPVYGWKRAKTANEGAASREGAIRFNRSSPTADVTAWYVKRVAAAPSIGYTREEDELAAKAVGIGRDRLRGLRSDHAPAHWSADGPKKSRF